MAAPMSEMFDPLHRLSRKELSEFMKHDERLNDAKQLELERLQGVTYVDFAGAAVYLDSQVDAFAADLKRGVYGNPHSGGAAGDAASDAVEQVRFRILQHFNTTPEDYSVLFTSGCTDALKLVAHNFSFHDNRPSVSSQPQTRCAAKVTGGSSVQGLHTVKEGSCGCFVYLDDNHTSLVGMREILSDKGASIFCASKEAFLSSDVRSCVNGRSGHALFAYPAQSNFSGERYPLTWVQEIQSESDSGGSGDCGPQRRFVLLDAAGYVCTSQLDLRTLRPDFVPVSFYKMFGFPTGVGALLVRRSSADALQKRYFGGGTVKMSLVRQSGVVHKDELCHRFEDGTINFLDIIALRHGFDALERFTGGFVSIAPHSFLLTACLHNYLTTSRHGNGQPVAKVYCDTGFDSGETQGPIIAFNLLKPTGDFVGFSQVSRVAEAQGVQLRVGCFCNMGACQRHLGLSDEHVQSNFQAGHVCGDDMDLVAGQPTGCVRVSLGFASTALDVVSVARFVETCFVQGRRPRDVTREYEELTATIKEEEVSEEHARGEEEPQELSEEVADTAETQADQEHIPDLGTHASGEGSEVAGERCPGPRENHVCDGMYHRIQGEDEAAGTEADVQEKDTIQLEKIYVYPVKSCAGFEVSTWPVGPGGLLHDRKWMVVTPSGVCVNQKRQSRLALIQPEIDVRSGELRLRFPGASSVSVPLSPPTDTALSTTLCNSKVCGDRIEGVDCGDEVADWLDSVLGCQGYRLLQQNTRRLRKPPAAGGGERALSLANEAQFLLINAASVQHLLLEMERGGDEPTPDVADLTERFRPNLVVRGDGGGGGGAFSEDAWKSVRIGACAFQVEKLCTRCGMICIDQKTGVRSREPLRTLTRLEGRRNTFGVLLKHVTGTQAANQSAVLSVGDHVDILEG